MFEIINCSESYFKKYVFLTDSEDLDCEVYEIYDALKTEMGETFNIIVDSFLRTGNAYNRFVELCFSNGRFKDYIIINPRDIDEYIKKQTFKELYNNIALLDSSSLAEREKEIVKNVIATIISE